MESKREINEDVEKAAEKMKHIKTIPTDEELLKLHALHKQATEGDVAPADLISRPLVDPFARAKIDAWSAQKGTPKPEAESNYVNMVQSMVDKYVQDFSKFSK